MKLFGLFVGMLALASASYFWLGSGVGSDPPSFRMASVGRQDIVVTIAATGTVEPEEIIDIGAQVAGIIKEFGRDAASDRTIDYGSSVEPGTVLARIDDAAYVEEVQLAKAALLEAHAKQKQAEAQIKQTQSNIKRAEADVAQAQVVLKQAIRERERGQSLLNNRATSQQEFETVQKTMEVSQAAAMVSEASLDQARTALESSDAVLAEAKARVEGAKAGLRKAETNLSYTTIRSPIKGVIIDRRVNIGQTVVANLNAPSLFLIAKDLNRVQVWVSVNEADIGSIKLGQPVKFAVDAYPNEEFRGVVGQVRMNATMVQSVVTYTVVVNVDNSSGLLLPYLTANLRFEVARRDNALVVPAAALRWKPRPERVVPDQRSALVARKKGGADKPAEATSSAKRGTVWILEGHFVRGIPVDVGLNDGNHVEIITSTLKEGQEIVTGEIVKAREKTVNPFTPSLTKGLDQSK